MGAGRFSGTPVPRLPLLLEDGYASEVFDLKPTRVAPRRRLIRSRCIGETRRRYDKTQIPWIGVEVRASYAPVATDGPTAGNRDLSDSVQVAESNPCGYRAALDGSDLRSLNDER